MHPPAGRIHLGARVAVSDGGRGEVVSERLIASNGAWAYVVRFTDGATAEHYDFELRPESAG